MLTHLGEAAHFSVEDLDTRPVVSAKMVFISAFFFQPESTRATAFQVVKAARSLQIPIAFDASDARLVEENGDLIMTVLEQYADFAFVNEPELQAVGSVCGEDPEAYLGKHVPTFLVKKGQQGATAFCHGRSHQIPAFTVDVVDTTGAGDAFAAGFPVRYTPRLCPCRRRKIGVPPGVARRLPVRLLPIRKRFHVLLEPI
jgi:sugar/nucleoside kinase (ribokinase family)